MRTYNTFGKNYSTTSTRWRLLHPKRLLWVRLVLLTVIGYKLLVDPESVLQFNGVLVLSSAMGLPILMYNEKSQVYGLVGVLFIGMVVSDVGPLLETNVKYFETTVLLRLIYSLLLCVYCYMSDYLPVCNSAVFSYAFIETWFGILQYNCLREEHYKRDEQKRLELNELSDKYDRGELTKEDARKYEKSLSEEEYKKIMSEFKK
ncbi:hypothetical protein HII13_004336 [Brettanomyces bruxellensis]|nr:hypothetical protein HII13_004336 [Brettanomyces bruxellensis]